MPHPKGRRPCSWTYTLVDISFHELIVWHLLKFSSIMCITVLLLLGLNARKPVFGGLQTTLAQTSLRICKVWSVPLLFAFWKVPYVNLQQVKFQYSNWETGLKLALPETLETDFVEMRPKWCFQQFFSHIMMSDILTHYSQAGSMLVVLIFSSETDNFHY